MILLPTRRTSPVAREFANRDGVFHGISVKAYLEPVEEQDFVDDGFVPYDEAQDVCAETGTQTAITCASPNATIQYHALESLGDPLLRIKVCVAGQVIFDRSLHADAGEEIQPLAHELAAITGRAVETIEHELACKVAELRKQAAKRKQASGASSFLGGVMNTAAFAAADCRREWLVKKLLVADEPVLLGGPKKSLKTSVVVDLALSLGSGTRFLNSFEVPQKRRCLILSGESGQATLQDAMRRVCAAKKISPESCEVHWGFELPKLSRDTDLKGLGAYVRQYEVKVVIIDPLYLCLMETGLNLSTANLFHTGPLLLQIAQACRDGGATPILVHHARKQMGGQHGSGNQPLDLDDLAFSGFAEFARQWLLINRRETYEPGTGLHKLWLNVGGSAGQSGLWGLDVEEGRLDTNFKGRDWKVRVLGRDDIQQEAIAAARVKKAEHEEQKKEEAKQAVFQVLMNNAAGETATGIREQVSCNKSLVPAVLAELARQERIRPVQVKKPHGKSGEAYYPGWALQSWGLIEPPKSDVAAGTVTGSDSPGPCLPAAGSGQAGQAGGDEGSTGGTEPEKQAVRSPDATTNDGNPSKLHG
jgi:AAA domain